MVYGPSSNSEVTVDSRAQGTHAALECIVSFPMGFQLTPHAFDAGKRKKGNIRSRIWGEETTNREEIFSRFPNCIDTPRVFLPFFNLTLKMPINQSVLNNNRFLIDWFHLF